MADAEGRPFTVLDTAAYLREEAGRRLESRLAALPRGGEEVTCRAGCFACCYHLVAVSPLEALAIREYVKERPELRAAGAERVDAWKAAVGARPALAAALECFEEAGGLVPDAEGAALEEAYWEARLPCPFLADGLCSIYPVRPFACREHLVTSDPALCAEGLDAPVSAGIRLEFRVVAAEVGEACHGLPDRSLLLPRVLEAKDGEAETPTAAAEDVRSAAESAQRRVRMALARLLLRRAPRPGSAPPRVPGPES